MMRWWLHDMRGCLQDTATERGIMGSLEACFNRLRRQWLITECAMHVLACYF